MQFGSGFDALRATGRLAEPRAGGADDEPLGAAAPAEAAPEREGALSGLAPFAGPILAEATFAGTPRPDDLIGGAAADRLTGLGGNDRLDGRGGRDTLDGGGGKDTLIGGAGGDDLKGGGGTDSLEGGGGGDTLDGGGGRDALLGGGGRDDLRGGGGNDGLDGGGGNDTLTGGKGSDSLTGAAGADTFRFAAADFAAAATDRIADFTPGADRVALDGFAGIASFADLDFVATADGVALLLGAGRVVFEGLAQGDLSAADFGLPAGGGGGNPPGGAVVQGGAGPDTLQGGAGNQEVRGEGGDDVIGTSAGTDTLRGGTGADAFVVRLLNGAVDPAFDRVADFQYGLGDKVSFVEALAGIAFDDIADVVRATPQTGGTMIAVDRGAGFQNVLFLEGVSFTTEALATYGFEAPPRTAAAFDPNPYGFTNQTNTVADPSITADGKFAVWVDKGNRDGDPNDEDPRRLDEFGNVIERASMDVFVLNIATGAAMRVTEAADDGSEFFFRDPSFPFSQFYSPDLSANGRFVFFATDADTFGSTPDNNNGANGFSGPGDIYRRDMLNLDAEPVLVTRLPTPDGGNFAVGGVPAPGFQAAFNTASPPILDASDNGDRVVFITSGFGFFGESDPNNFEGGQRIGPDNRLHADVNLEADVYVREISTGRTFLVTATDQFDASFENTRFSVGGVPDSYPDNSGLHKAPSVGISGDGRFVVFVSRFDFDPSDDDGGAMDVFVQNVDTGATRLVSKGLATDAFAPTISQDGRTIAFGFEKVAGSGDFAVRVVHFDRASLTVSNALTIDATGRGEYNPVLSPDGRRLGYLSIDPNQPDFDPVLRVASLGAPGTGAPVRTADVAVGDYLGDTHFNVEFDGPGFANFDLSNGGIVFRRSEEVGEDNPFGGAPVFGDRIVFDDL